MDTIATDPGHEAAVDAWIERSLPSLPIEIVGLFHEALEAVWNRAVTTLGTVTLTAIAERVLYTAVERYGFLSAINPRPNGDARWRAQLHERLAAVPRAELVGGLRFALVELLRVIGSLTAEILSADLHAALAKTIAATTDASMPAAVAPTPTIDTKAKS